MISKTQAYRASDGTFCATLAEAQNLSLRAFFYDVEAGPHQAEAIANKLLEHRDAIMDILTTTKRSRPGRRLVNGFKQKRAGKAAEASAATAA